MKYLVGTNIPGYLPDNDPNEYDNYEVACEGLLDELDRDLAACEEYQPCQQLATAMDDVHSAKRVYIESVAAGRKQLYTPDLCYFCNGRVYWLVLAKMEENTPKTA